MIESSEIRLFAGLDGVLVPGPPAAMRPLLTEPAADAIDGALLRARGMAPAEICRT